MQMRTTAHQTNLKELDKTEQMCQNKRENIVRPSTNRQVTYQKVFFESKTITGTGTPGFFLCSIVAAGVDLTLDFSRPQ